MASVRINGEEHTFATDGGLRVVDLVELIKSQIDPEHMITRITVDGRDLEEAEWQAPISQFQSSVFDVDTGTPVAYVKDRMSQAPDVVQRCYMQFRQCRKAFQHGDMKLGNETMIVATRNLKAFFEWYQTLTELVPTDRKSEFKLNDEMNMISEICKRVCQQQLYQSWWALGETLEKELEPKLDYLEDLCRRSAAKL